METKKPAASLLSTLTHTEPTATPPLAFDFSKTSKTISPFLIFFFPQPAATRASIFTASPFSSISLPRQQHQHRHRSPPQLKNPATRSSSTEPEIYHQLGGRRLTFPAGIPFTGFFHRRTQPAREEASFIGADRPPTTVLLPQPLGTGAAFPLLQRTEQLPSSPLQQTRPWQRRERKQRTDLQRSRSVTKKKNKIKSTVLC